DDLLLPAPELGPDGEVGGHEADGGGHPGGADLGPDVAAVDPDEGHVGIAADLEVEFAGDRGDGRLVGEVDTTLEAGPAHGPVHGTGVEVLQAQSAGHEP